MCVGVLCGCVCVCVWGGGGGVRVEGVGGKEELQQNGQCAWVGVG